ncbi:MAG: hypothetical protein OXN16_15835 [Gammaproteobacteria bacterium]|nr:hypothetical protein [Gammaproteobacteria bacterium]
MRRENEDELLALNWLKKQGYSDIQKPCSDPPDFVVDGNLAVEVTRISQRIALDSGSQTKAEEEIRKPLTGVLREIFEKLGPPGNKGRSWVVDCEYDFSSPLPNGHVRGREHPAPCN